MWKDICLANRELLLKQINTYRNELTRMHEMLEDNDGSSTGKIFPECTGNTPEISERQPLNG